MYPGAARGVRLTVRLRVSGDSGFQKAPAFVRVAWGLGRCGRVAPAAARFPRPPMTRYDGSSNGLGRVREGWSMSVRTCLTIVLAAGEGTRMCASRPKVLHAIGGRSLIAHVLAAAGTAGGAQAVVVGPAQDTVVAAVEAAMPGAELFVQAQRRGTAHAVLA